MTLVHTSIVVPAPPERVAELWQVRDFPDLVDGVREVRRLTETRTRWQVVVAGAEVEFDAEAIRDTEPERVRWHTVAGRRHAGVVTFEPTPDGGTRVDVRLAATPGTALERLGAGVGLLRARVDAALRQFAAHVAARYQRAPV